MSLHMTNIHHYSRMSNKGKHRPNICEESVFYHHSTQKDIEPNMKHYARTCQQNYYHNMCMSQQIPNTTHKGFDIPNTRHCSQSTHFHNQIHTTLNVNILWQSGCQIVSNNQYTEWELMSCTIYRGKCKEKRIVWLMSIDRQHSECWCRI